MSDQKEKKDPPAPDSRRVSGVCRCGGHYAATMDNGGEVFHDLPPCESFTRLDPIAFLRWVRMGDA